MKRKYAIFFCTDGGERFFGAGPYRLLRNIEALGSLRSAAQHMGMAYAKAFHLMKRAEACFGFPLVQRKTGGKGGGGSALTPQAEDLLARYEAYEAACARMADSLYEVHFSTFRPEGSAAGQKEEQ